jgi:hypothetical protein
MLTLKLLDGRGNADLIYELGELLLRFCRRVFFYLRNRFRAHDELNLYDEYNNPKNSKGP